MATTITRTYEFDAAHRVMNERVKCFNLHGHRFKVDMTFGFEEVSALGYAIDFKEIKRVACSFLDEFFDHGCILNPFDEDLIALCNANGWKTWIMGFGERADINPSAEAIAQELFTIFGLFFNKEEHEIWITNVRLYETPNCWVDCNSGVTAVKRNHHTTGIELWRAKKGNECYDIRKCQKAE